MTEALAFDHLVQALHEQLASLPDDRKGKNTQYAIKDAALGAFAVWCSKPWRPGRPFFRTCRR